MNQKRAIYLLIFLLGFAIQQAYSQSSTPINGIVNAYTAVNAILCEEVGNDDSVVVASTAAFAVGDTVMLYAVKGAIIGDSVDLTPGSNPFFPPGEDAQLPRNSGKYAFMIIREVINPGNTLVFNVTLDPEFKPMVEGEMAQLIRVPSFRNATVTSAGLTSESWNPMSGTGGVVALFVHGVLELDGDIDLSGRGFRGAPGSSDLLYSGACSSTDTMLYYKHFYPYTDHRAGLKGEGTTDTIFHGIGGMRGKASSINGGGGGNGRLAGGGGGSNFSNGLRGGEESSICTGTGVSVTGGAGGFGLSRDYYKNNNVQQGNRIFFGGGGGSGTQINVDNSTDGGDGGGIVVIVADTIIGNGHEITVDGDSIVEVALNGTGTGGGGGGGGCIILDVAGYKSTLDLSAVGGNGGDISGTATTGMGGAGGGGIYWLAGDTHPGVIFDYTPAKNGKSETYELPGAAGLPGQKDELVTPLRGFLFNPVPGEFTYCSDVDPDPIVTSEPKGGDGTYTYQWIDSSSTQDIWNNIDFATDRDYDPDPLSDTIYYRRIVYSLGLADTSFLIAVNIHPAINGNTIAAADTVCSGNAPILFESASTIGGGPTGGSYTYKWQHMPFGDGSFTDVSAISSDPDYQSSGLTVTTEFRRIAYAGVCLSTSNVDEVRVLETLTGNAITSYNAIPYDTICINTVPDQITGPVPSNGDQADIRYQWLTSINPLAMGSLLPGEINQSYQSPALNQTTYIRRVVLSGNDNACKDTSAFVEILNVPDITDNTIAASQTVCQENTPNPLTASTPGGGYLSQYTYTWISSTDQSNWVPATGGGDNDVLSNFNPGAMMDGDTTWYRRVVESGGPDLVCKDTSDFIVINVHPSITYNTLTPADNLKCQLDTPEIITGALPGGGDTEGPLPTRIYRWEVAEGETVPGSWSHPVGATAKDYTDPNLLNTDVDRWYRRIVTSGACEIPSDTVHLVVHSEITSNAIDSIEAICFSDTRPLRHASLAGGENTIAPVYTWRGWLEGETSADAIPIAGSNQQAFESGPYSDPATLIYYFDRVVEIGACLDTSNAMKVTVMQLPGGELIDADFPACERDTVLKVDLNMGALTVGHYVTPWNMYLKDGVHTGIGPGLLDKDMDTMGIVMDTDGADHVSYTYEIESIRYYPEGDDYYCISPAGDPEGNIIDNPVVVDLSRKPDPQILVDGAARDSFKVCNTTAMLELLPDNGTLSTWSEPAGSVFFFPGTEPNEQSVSIPNNRDDFGEYRIFVMSEVGDCAGFDSIDLHFFEQPAPAYAGEDTMIFLNNVVQLRADPPTAGIGTWELISGNGIVEDENAYNTFASELGLGEENKFRWTVINGEDEGICISSNDVTIVIRNEVKRYNGFSPNEDMSNEYYIMQGLPYADEFSVSFFNSLGNTVRTIDQDNVGELVIDPALIANGLRDDEMVIWDGRAENGNLVPSGTYYFVVTFIMHQRDYLTGEIIRTDTYDFKDYVVVVRE